MRKVRDEVECHTLAASLALTLPFPPSANEYWRSAPGRGPVPSKAAMQYKAQVAQHAASRGFLPLVGPVTVCITAYRPRRTGDLDNVLKVLHDALNEVAWLDDDQVVRLEATRADDAANPRVELTATATRFATREEAQAHRAAREERARKTRETRNRHRRLREAGQLPTPPAKKRARKPTTAQPQETLPLATPAPAPAWKTPLPPGSIAGVQSYGSRHAGEFQVAPWGNLRQVAKALRGRVTSASHPADDTRGGE